MLVKIPLEPRGKRPLVRWAGPVTPEDMQAWWASAPPDANVGLRLDDLVVVDCDSPEAVKRWQETGPATPCVVTTGRGAHFYYAGDPDVRPGPYDTGIDIKAGRGAFVVASGSTHENGKRYDGPLPSEIVSAQLPPPPPEVVEARSAPTSATSDTEGWDKIPSGRRNDTLTRVAGSMRASGASATTIATFLHGLNKFACDPPLPADEVIAIARSMARYEPDPDIVIEDDEAPDSPLADRFTHGALMAQPMLPVKWVLKDFIPEGLTLFCGRPKVGKSWFMLGLAQAVAEGSRYFGTDVEQGDVLYLALEDNHRRLQRRLSRLWSPVPLGDSFQLSIRHPRLPEALKGIVEWYKSVERPRLVIIDTLAKVRPVTSGDEKLYMDDYEAIAPLQMLAGRMGIGINLVHHTRKAEAEDVLDTVSGTTGLAGSADTILVLTQTLLAGRGRDLEEDIHQGAILNRDTCQWEPVAETEVVLEEDDPLP